MLELRGTSPAFFMDEIWKSIPGYETHYEASSHGRVRSRRRLVVDIKDGKERRRIFKERILSPNIQVSRGSRHSVMLSVQVLIFDNITIIASVIIIFNFFIF